MTFAQIDRASRFTASRRTPELHSVERPEKEEPGAAGFPLRPVAFLWHYIKRRPLVHLGALACVVAAATFASVSQYGLKLIVDALAEGPQYASNVWWTLAVFLALVGSESIFWR